MSRHHRQKFGLELRFPDGAIVSNRFVRVEAGSWQQAVRYAYNKFRAPSAEAGKPALRVAFVRPVEEAQALSAEPTEELPRDSLTNEDIRIRMNVSGRFARLCNEQMKHVLITPLTLLNAMRPTDAMDASIFAGRRLASDHQRYLREMRLESDQQLAKERLARSERRDANAMFCAVRNRRDYWGDQYGYQRDRNAAVLYTAECPEDAVGNSPREEPRAGGFHP